MTVYTAIKKTKERLIRKVATKGIYENFGSKEVMVLKDKYNYSDLVYGTPEQKKQADAIENFRDWTYSYNG